MERGCLWERERKGNIPRLPRRFVWSDYIRWWIRKYHLFTVVRCVSERILERWTPSLSLSLDRSTVSIIIRWEEKNEFFASKRSNVARKQSEIDHRLFSSIPWTLISIWTNQRLIEKRKRSANAWLVWSRRENPIPMKMSRNKLNWTSLASFGGQRTSLLLRFSRLLWSDSLMNKQMSSHVASSKRMNSKWRLCEASRLCVCVLVQ